MIFIDGSFDYIQIYTRTYVLTIYIHVNFKIYMYMYFFFKVEREITLEGVKNMKISLIILNRYFITVSSNKWYLLEDFNL